ncbi:CHYB1B [Auxenochlorella protothecoides x Auxenochlorella symbiontica]
MQFSSGAKCLQFRHDCQNLGCSNLNCPLCKTCQRRRCEQNFASKYLAPCDVLEAKCGAQIYVVVVDAMTGQLVHPDIDDPHLQICIVDGRRFEQEGEREEALESCMLLVNKQGQPLLSHGRSGTFTDEKRIMVPLILGQAMLPDLKVTDSSEALLLGRAPPFRLLVRLADRLGHPCPGVKHALSEPFVVATARVKGAAKADIPHVDDHVSKIECVGVQTQRKLEDIAAAGAAAGVADLRVPVNCVTRVGQFRELVELAEGNKPLRETLKQVLRLTKGWDVARDHVRRCVDTDERLRVFHPDGRTDVGLAFRCAAHNVVDLNRPLGLLRRRQNPAQPNQEMVDVIWLPQDAAAFPEAVRRLLPQAFSAWWREGHPGWALLPLTTSAHAPRWDEAGRPATATASFTFTIRNAAAAAAGGMRLLPGVAAAAAGAAGGAGTGGAERPAVSRGRPTTSAESELAAAAARAASTSPPPFGLAAADLYGGGDPGTAWGADPGTPGRGGQGPPGGAALGYAPPGAALGYAGAGAGLHRPLSSQSGTVPGPSPLSGGRSPAGMDYALPLGLQQQQQGGVQGAGAYAQSGPGDPARRLQPAYGAPSSAPEYGAAPPPYVMAGSHTRAGGRSPPPSALGSTGFAGDGGAALREELRRRQRATQPERRARNRELGAGPYDSPATSAGSAGPGGDGPAASFASGGAASAGGASNGEASPADFTPSPFEDPSFQSLMALVAANSGQAPGSGHGVEAALGLTPGGMQAPLSDGTSPRGGAMGGAGGAAPRALPHQGFAQGHPGMPQMPGNTKRKADTSLEAWMAMHKSLDVDLSLPPNLAQMSNLFPSLLPTEGSWGGAYSIVGLPPRGPAPGSLQDAGPGAAPAPPGGAAMSAQRGGDEATLMDEGPSLSFGPLVPLAEQGGPGAAPAGPAASTGQPVPVVPQGGHAPSASSPPLPPARGDKLEPAALGDDVAQVSLSTMSRMQAMFQAALRQEIPYSQLEEFLRAHNLLPDGTPAGAGGVTPPRAPTPTQQPGPTGLTDMKSIEAALPEYPAGSHGHRI